MKFYTSFIISVCMFSVSILYEILWISFIRFDNVSKTFVVSSVKIKVEIDQRHENENTQIIWCSYCLFSENFLR